jgi:putative membrane protein
MKNGYVVKMFLLFGLAIWVYFLIRSNIIASYVHPRMNILLILSAGFLAILALVEMKRIFTVGSSSSIRMHYLLVVLPVALGLTIPPSNLSADLAETRGVRIGESTTIFNDSSTVQGDISADYSVEKTDGMGELDNSDDVLYIGSDNFVASISDIFINLDIYTGTQVTFSGFYYRTDNMPVDQFIIARMIISCCAADASMAGLVCIDDGAATDFEMDGWYSVQGTVTSLPMGGQMYPAVQISSWNKEEEPSTRFVF